MVSKFSLGNGTSTSIFSLMRDSCASRSASQDIDCKPGFVVGFGFRRGKHQHHLNRSGGHAVRNRCREAMSRVDLAGDSNGRHDGMSLKVISVPPLYRGDFKARTGRDYQPLRQTRR